MRRSISGLGLLAFVFPVAALAQLSILPTSQTVSNAGNSATYVVTITNPTGTTQVFVPSTTGISAAWGVQLPASVTVGPGGMQNFDLVLTTPLNLPSGSYPFTVIANTAGNALSYSVPATLIVAAASPPVTPAPQSLILICAGLACAGLYAVRRRLRRAFPRG
jgi:hypothetical protein